MINSIQIGDMVWVGGDRCAVSGINRNTVQKVVQPSINDPVLRANLLGEDSDELDRRYDWRLTSEHDGSTEYLPVWSDEILLLPTNR